MLQLPKNFSLFPTLSDYPDPPREEIVEPKSLRNTLIRTLAYMALLPALAMFFLLNDQLRVATESADKIQLAIAQNIATVTRGAVMETVRFAHFNMKKLTESNIENRVVINDMLAELGRECPDVAALDWHSDDGQTYRALSNRPMQVLKLTKNGVDDPYSQVWVQTDNGQGNVALLLHRQIKERHYYLDVKIKLSAVNRAIERATKDRWFSVTLLNENQVVLSNAKEPEKIVESISDNDLKAIRANPYGIMIASPGPRNIAAVRSFLIMPDLGWTIVVGEPVAQRDALIRSSYKTTAIVLLLALIISIGAGILTAFPIARSVNLLSEAVSRFGRTGKFQSVVKDLEKEGSTEIVTLGKNFEEMFKAVTDTRDQLQKLNANLEAEVRERTAELAKEHATLSAVFESITDGIVILGRSGKAIYANDLAQNLLNNGKPIAEFDCQDLIRSRWKPFNPTDEMPESFDEIKQAMRLTAKERPAVGKKLVIEILTFKVDNLPGISGERTGLLIRDMTQEAEIESMKDNLISVVAHELKTPVTALRLQAEALRHYSTENKVTQLQDIDGLIEEASRLGQLIDNLLDVSRIMGGAMRTTLAPKVVQIASIIDRAARLSKSRYEISITREIDPEAETLQVDPDRLTQVFVNLFNNAARYKKVDQSQAICDVMVEPRGDNVQIVITDYGRGIEPDKIKNVFERFYQADMTDERISGGIGLGLPIVRGIIQSHHGTISVESEVGHYTRFTILLPY